MSAMAKPASTPGLVHPQSEPRLMASRADVMPRASSTEPATSNRLRGPRSVSGMRTSATRRATKHKGAWTRKITRHPTASTSGPPITTPSTGAPADTRLK